MPGFVVLPAWFEQARLLRRPSEAQANKSHIFGCHAMCVISIVSDALGEKGGVGRGAGALNSLKRWTFVASCNTNQSLQTPFTYQ